MHKALIILSLLAISGFATSTYYQELNPLWSTWKAIHKKEYSAAEEVARFSIFIDNYKKIIEYNAAHTNPKLGLGIFSDLTSEEFNNKFIGGFQKEDQDDTKDSIQYGLIKAPDSIDWRQKNVLNPVKYQGQCGSCWAFSTIGALESFYAINKGQLLSFSEQQLVDCDSNDGGCNGGNPGTALEYTASSGVITDDKYPYSGQQGQCQYNNDGTKVNSGSNNVKSNSVDDLKSAIAVSPVTVALDGSGIFQNYKSGIIDANSGCGTELNHAVLAVGYGNINGQGDAFIIRNSWSEQWGDQGYGYISTDGSANGGAGVCSILSQVIAVK